MERNETRVLYKAIADFSSLSKAARKARKDLADLKKEERDFNNESSRGTTNSDNRRKNEQKLIQEQIHSMRQLNRELRDSTTAVRKFSTELDRSNTSRRRFNSTSSETSNHTRRNTKDFNGLEAVLARLRKSTDGVADGFNRIRDWRPRLIPPFIALVPIIGGLLALVNPLVAGISALGMATFGFASSLASLSGVALTVIPGLTAIISLVASLKTAFGGIGTVFQRYTAMKDATSAGGGGGGGPVAAELSRAEQLARANTRYARAIEDVRWAQEDLNKAREDYIKLLEDLEKAVQDAAKAEGIANDNARFSAEYYAEIANDPNVAEADKVAAAEYAEYLREQAEEAKEVRIETEKELKEAKKGGVDNNRQVIQAQRRLEDATWALRDAQLALINAQRGVGGSASAAANAEDAFKKALDKLSPSARDVVLSLIALKEEWEKVQQVVQESFFSKIVDDVKLLSELLPPLQTLLSSAAGAAGGVTSDLIRRITSDDWLNDISTVAGQNVTLIENYGEALGHILEIFRDITIAAGPFAEALSEGFAEGAENLSDLVANAREDGSLAEWLETVRERLGMWWRIIKNIGETLFNYGAASAEFGEWLTGSFEDRTEKWLENSRAAREEDSKFQEYLEDLKPLLEELSGLAGDFFSWFSEVSMDPEVIQNMTDIAAAFREDLGPAIGDLLDVLAKSEVGESLIAALADLVYLIVDFLEKGGLEGFEAFYDVLSDIFKAFSDLIDKTPQPVLEGIATVLGTLSAMTFLGLGRILGLLSFILGRKLALDALTKTLTAMGVLKGVPVVPPVVPGGKTPPLKPTPVGPNGRMPITGLAPVPPAGGGGVGGFAKNLIKSPIAKAGVAGLIAGVITELTAGQLEDGEGGIDDLAAASVRGSWAGPLGAAISIMMSDIDFDTVLADAEARWQTFLDWLSGAWDNIAQYFRDLPSQIGALGSILWEGLQGIGGWLGEQWSALLTWLQSLPTRISMGAGYIWGQIVKIGYWLEEQWNAFYAWLISLPEQIGIAAGALWGQIVSIGVWLGEQWDAFVLWLQDLPQNIADISGDIWRFIQGILPWLEQQWSNFLGWLQGLPEQIEETAVDLWDGLGGVADWLGEQLDLILGWFKGLPGRVRETANNAWSDILSGFKIGFDVSGAGSGKNVKKVEKNTGGQIPGSGNTDTVPTMLTPGEFVIRKAVVRKLGAHNLESLNAGFLSIAGMLKRSEPEAGSGLSFFNSGGLVGLSSGVTSPTVPNTALAPVYNNYVMENVNINNPVGEPSEDSLISAGQELAFVNGWTL